MKKIIVDRLNHLKSLLADEKRPKLTKTHSDAFIYECQIRIAELEYIKSKL